MGPRGPMDLGAYGTYGTNGQDGRMDGESCNNSLRIRWSYGSTVPSTEVDERILGQLALEIPH